MMCDESGVNGNRCNNFIDIAYKLGFILNSLEFHTLSLTQFRSQGLSLFEMAACLGVFGNLHDCIFFIYPTTLPGRPVPTPSVMSWACGDRTIVLCILCS